MDFGKEVDALQHSINLWKDDAKWTKNSTEVKKKKVFEVKWLMRSLIEGKLAKKGKAGSLKK